MEIKISRNLYWVGVIDWPVRKFHGFHYNTMYGTTYNAYLIQGKDTIALVDTVDIKYFDEYKARIEAIVPLEKINYVIANHAEPDHSGCLKKILEYIPKAVVVSTPKCKDVFDRYYGIKNEYRLVRTGNELNLGEVTLKFIDAVMLHWPDSMFTLLSEDRILLPNDAFGQHIASSERFADEINPELLWSEARKYYANILTPFSPLVKSKLEEIGKMDLTPEIIAPSHGLIWRRREDIGKIVTKYSDWANGVTNPSVVIVYDTMWGRTEKMVKKLVSALEEKSVRYRLYRIPEADKTEIMGEFMEARGIVLASPTMNSAILTTLSEFTDELIGLRFKNKIGVALGSFGWAGGSVKMLEEKLKKAGVEVIEPGVEAKYEPNEEEYMKCYELGLKLAARILAEE